MSKAFYAPLISTIVWIICYLISLYCFIYKFSNGIIPRRLREKTDSKFTNYLLIAIIFVSPIIVGFIYIIIAFIDKKHSQIFWGARIDNFPQSTFILWLLSLFFLLFFLIFAIIKPSYFNFEKWNKALLLYILHHFYTYFIIFMITILLSLITGPLSRINSTSGGFD